MAKVIIRRRVIDLLRRDARPNNHHSLETVPASSTETETALAALDDGFAYNPRAQLELRQVIEMVHRALACFAAQGTIQGRQAQLLQRHIVDETDYRELSTELTCSENALRVRVCKAMLALRRHVRMGAANPSPGIKRTASFTIPKDNPGGFTGPVFTGTKLFPIT